MVLAVLISSARILQGCNLILHRQKYRGPVLPHQEIGRLGQAQRQLSGASSVGDFRFFNISVKRGKGGRTINATVRIVMRTYTMNIPLFSLQPATIGLLLSDDKVNGIRDKLSWEGKYGTADSLQGIKGGEAQPPPLS